MNIQNLTARKFCAVFYAMLIVAGVMAGIFNWQGSISTENGGNVLFANVNLSCLSSNMSEYANKTVVTNGTVRLNVSILMYEDFWLEDNNDSSIPVVARFSDLQIPSENTSVAVSGIIEWYTLKDDDKGFYFLNATAIQIFPTVTVFDDY